MTDVNEAQMLKETDLKESKEKTPDPVPNHNNETKHNITLIDNKFEENELDILLEKTGLGWEHIKIIILLVLYITGEGFVMIGVSLIIPVIAVPWKLTELQKGLIGSSVFLGFTFGALSSGYVSDRKGRRLSFVIGNIVSLTGGIFGVVFAKSVIPLVISNALVGFGIGISVPAAMTLCSEVTNTKIRSILIGWVWIFFSVGEILACVVAMEFEMYVYENSHWKLLLLFRCISFCISVPFIFVIAESPKFLLTRNGKRDAEAFEIVEKLLGENKKYLLSNEMKVKISKQYATYMHGANEKRNNYKDLLNAQNCKLSIILFSLWYLSSFIFYGLIFILPSVYQHLALSEHDAHHLDAKMYDQIVNDIIFSCIFEFPSNILNGILPNIIGRKATIMFGWAGSFVCSLLCCFSAFSLPLYSAITKAFINTAFGVLYVYTTEAYPTYMRTTGLGTCNFFARVGGVTTPFISQFLFKLKFEAPFFGYACFSFLGLSLTMLVEETQGIHNY